MHTINNPFLSSFLRITFDLTHVTNLKDNGYFAHDSPHLQMPFLKRWPLFIVRKMRGQVHQQRLDSAVSAKCFDHPAQ